MSGLAGRAEESWMAVPSVFDFMRLPVPLLIALDSRPLHFALQPYHHLVRALHILSTSAFFGGIGLLDFRLMGWRGTVPLRGFAENVLPVLYATFGVAVGSGALLFAYDPLHVGSHAYFAPKLALIALGLLNALLFHRTTYLTALASAGSPPASARIAGAVSLALWVGVLVCASFNAEPAPKLLLQ